MSLGESWEELRAVWAPGQLAPVAPERISDAPMSERTREFLTRFGLPVECPLLVTFYRDERLLRPLSSHGLQYLLVGDDCGSLLGLRAGTDELWSITESADQPYFVNSHLWGFVHLLGLYQPHAYPGFMRQVAACDENALDHVGNWWSLIVEQMSHGLAP